MWQQIFGPGFNRQILFGLAVVIAGIFLSPFIIGLPLFALGWVIIFYGIGKQLFGRWQAIISWFDLFGFSQLPKEVQEKIKAIVFTLFILAFFLFIIFKL